jgi:hypothetical protein
MMSLTVPRQPRIHAVGAACMGKLAVIDECDYNACQRLAFACG